MAFIPIVIGAFSTELLKGLGNKRTSGDHPDYYIIENDQNTEKSSGNLRTFAVIQTSVKDYHLTLV